MSKVHIDWGVFALRSRYALDILIDMNYLIALSPQGDKRGIYKSRKSRGFLSVF